MAIEDQPQSMGSHASAPQQADEILLGRYRVLSRRGTGGFGTVCTCWDTQLQRRVAIKRIPLISTGPDGIPVSSVDEVIREAQTESLLAHPNIVSVFDFYHDERFAYLIMEYVDGLNLAELLARVEGGRLTPEECAHVLDSCARALAFAHENRVLHMDIKPTNIMIDRMGTVKIADFGMAELGAATGYGGARGGTVGYMPPEQIEGMLVDERADVFSLAVVIWQSLAGRNPFLAASAGASLEKIRRGPQGSRSKSDLGLGPEAEAVLVRALAPTASERTSSVDELACELAPYLGDATAGQASLAGLVNQSEADEGEDEVGWTRRHIPLHLRVPQAWAVAERALPALFALLCVAAVLPHVAGVTSQIELGCIVAAAVLSAVWPPISAVAAGAATVAALATMAPSSASFVFAGAFGVAVATWWALIGRREGLSCVAVLAPWTCGFPVAGAQMAGFSLDPADALATGLASYLIGEVFCACSAAGFAAAEASSAALAALAAPATWVCAAGCALSAWLSSIVAMRGSVVSGIVGQVLGLAAMFVTLSLKAGVENGGIWSSPDMGTCAVAVLCFTILCVLTVLRGPLYEDQEGEDHELF